MDRSEAQQVIQTALETERQRGYEQLRASAPYPVEARRALGIFKRQEWRVPDDCYVTRTLVGESGATYYVEREVDWDSDYGGALRVWVYVHDGESRTMEKPEFASDLIYPPG